MAVDSGWIWDPNSGGVAKGAGTPVTSVNQARQQYAAVFGPPAPTAEQLKQMQLASSKATARNVAANASQYDAVNIPIPPIDDAQLISSPREILIGPFRFNDGKDAEDTVYAFPSGPARKLRIDTIETPGIEYEQLKFKGRSLFACHIELRTWTDAGLAKLTNIVKTLMPPLSDTGVKMVAPKVWAMIWQPTLDQGMKNFTIVDDDGIVTYNEQGRYYTWGATFKQFAQWKGPGVLPYHGPISGDVGNAPIVNPTDPSSQQPNAALATVGVGI